MPAFKKRPVPTTSKKAASAPARLIVLLPRASSLMAMSPTLMAVRVGVFSSRLVRRLLSTTAVGASLTSVIASA